DFTGQNVYRGLAGFQLYHDTVDSGNEHDPNPAALRLPAGEYDIPIVIQDKLFDKNGILIYDAFNHDGLLGNKFCMNGKVQPFFRVARRKYRFGFLNGSNSRFYEIYLSSGQPWIIIGSDDNLTPRPVPNPFVHIAPAERYDVVVDFSKYAIGDEIVIQNRLRQ